METLRDAAADALHQQEGRGGLLRRGRRRRHSMPPNKMVRDFRPAFAKQPRVRCRRRDRQGPSIRSLPIRSSSADNADIAAAKRILASKTGIPRPRRPTRGNHPRLGGQGPGPSYSLTLADAGPDRNQGVSRRASRTSSKRSRTRLARTKDLPPGESWTRSWQSNTAGKNIPLNFHIIGGSPHDSQERPPAMAEPKSSPRAASSRGPLGSAQEVVAHAGETVRTPAQEARRCTREAAVRPPSGSMGGSRRSDGPQRHRQRRTRHGRRRRPNAIGRQLAGPDHR